MTDDPLTELRATLMGAARERARPRRRRRALLLGAAATAVLVPAAAAATGAFRGGSTTLTFADRSRLRVSVVPDRRRGGATCQRVAYVTATGVSRVATVSCPARTGPAPDGRLQTGFTAQPGNVVMLLGRTPRGTARVDVPRALDAVAFDAPASLFAAPVPADEPMLAIARDASGRELARFRAPAMEP